MAKLGDLVAVIGANTKPFNKAMNDMQRKTKYATQGMEKLGKSMSLAVSAPIALMTKSAIENFDKQAKAVAQVEQGLKSTGGAVGFTSEQLQKMASDLQKTSLFGDEEIMQGATAQLLTFTNIAGDQFARTQKAAMDLATRLDGDLKSSSIQLGKALNDPVANLSALSRSGIQFSEDQKAVIKSLAETGRLADAQTIILDELEKQYGGSAEAAAKAGTGPLKQFQMAMGDLTEAFGQIIVEAITPFVKHLQNIVERFQGVDIGTKKVITAFTMFAGAIGPVLLITAKFIQAYGTLKVAITKGAIPAVQKLTRILMANPYLLVAGAVVALGVAMSDYVHFTDAATSAQESFQKTLGQANVEAAKNAATVERLSSVVQDETKSQDERRAALKKLQGIAPDYFGSLDMEAVKMGELKTAVDAYKDSLLRAAKQKVYTAKLEELIGKQEELKNEFAEGPGYLDMFLGAMSGTGTASAAMMARLGPEAKALATEIDMLTEAIAQNEAEMSGKGADFKAQQIAKLKEQLKGALLTQRTFQKGSEGYVQMQEHIDGLKIRLDKLTKVTPPDTIEPLQTVIDKANEATEAIRGTNMAQMESRGPSQIDTGIGAPDQLGGQGTDWAAMGAQANDTLDETDKKLKGMREASEQFGSALGNAFGVLLEGGDQAQESMKNLGKSLLKTLLGVARANAVALFSSPANPANAATGGLATPAVIAGGLALVEGLMGAIAFADGGIVSGPTLGLVGEYAGARNNPEVIAPLDKLQGMLNNSGGGSIVPEVKIKGSDLVLVMEKGQKDINRRR